MKNDRFRCLALLALLLPLAVGGCSSDTEDPTRSTNLELTSSVEILDRGAQGTAPYSFDISSSGAATATVLGLGLDARIESGGDLFLYRYGADTSEGYSLRLAKGETSRVERSGNRLTVVRKDFSVVYEHRREGLKQSFIFQSIPENEHNRLRVVQNFPRDFDHTLISNEEVVVSDKNGKVLSWTDLNVFDATGRTLPASFVVEPGKLIIDVDTRGAVTPVTVDPLASSPSWSEFGADDGERFAFTGRSVDINNDGFSDIVIGQSRYSSPETREGRALLYLGSTNGLASTAIWQFENNLAQSSVGNTVARLGDVNGDGIEDIAVAGVFTPTPTDFTGRIYIFYGSPTGPSNIPNATLDGTTNFERYGRTMVSGDFNCDGFSDLAVGNDPGSNGKVDIYYGSATGLSNAPDLTLAPADLSGLYPQALGTGGSLTGETNSVGGVDVICEDLIIGDIGWDGAAGNDSGRVFLHEGSSAGLGTAPSLTLEGDQANSSFGSHVSVASDFNNDGFADMTIGASLQSLAGVSSGALRIYLGGSTLPGTTPDFTLSGATNDERFGARAATGLDVNGDGFTDAIVASNRFSGPQSSEGKLYAFLGSASGIDTTPAWEYESNTANGQLGLLVTSGGDINGDGLDDLLAGSFVYPQGGATVGAAFVFDGVDTCTIGGTNYVDGAENPANPCEVCNISLDQTDWSILADATPCDDNDLCTSGESCQAGACVPAATVMCNDGNQCTSDTCEPSTGLCDFEASDRDGESCTIPGGQACLSGACSSGTCDASIISGCLIGGTCYQDGERNPANDCEVCDSSLDDSDWTTRSAGDVCDDGLFCTVSTTCNASGQCVGAPRDCSGVITECFTDSFCNEFENRCDAISPAPAGTSCGGDLCTTNGMCDGTGVCSGQQTDCTNLDTECMVGVCDATDGSCSAEPRADGTSCDDGDACTQNSACVAGSCEPGTPITCDDGNPCTADSCDSATGCVFDPAPVEGDTCDDGDACTENDICTSGTCGGDAITCDDGNTCTSQACDPAVGCTFDELADGTPCVGDALGCTTDACASGVCESTLDANFCVIDDACVAEGVENPDNTCEVCDPALSTDSYSPKTDGEACGLGQCNAENTGVVSGSCNVGVCTPGDAADDIACDPYVCANGACLDACVADEDCQGDLVCEDSECTEPPEACEDDDDCDGEQVCVDDVCVDPEEPIACEEDDDCDGEQVCVDDVCVDPEEPVACEEDDDCDGEQVCVDDVCVDPDVPVECEDDNDCDSDEICNDRGQCEDPDAVVCTDDLDCGEGSRCIDAICVSGTIEGGGCGCAASGTGPMEDASWLLVLALGALGWTRRRR